MTKTLIAKIEHRHNGNPDNGPVGFIGFTASWTMQSGREFRGCPLGRALTIEGAVSDLVHRTNSESGTSILVADVVWEAPGPHPF